jgi:hypothetical protein
VDLDHTGRALGLKHLFNGSHLTLADAAQRAGGLDVA